MQKCLSANEWQQLCQANWKAKASRPVPASDRCRPCSRAALKGAVATCAPSCLQDSIKQSQQWFLACTPFASRMAAKMAQQVRQLSDHTRQLHVLYMANDILLKR